MWRSTSSAERVRDDVGDEAPAVPVERHHVEAELHGPPLARQQHRAEPDELLLLAPAAGFASIPPPARLPRLPLGDDERGSAADDEVDLAAADADVAPDHAVAAQAVEPQGPPLAELPEPRRRDSHRAPRIPRSLQSARAPAFRP